MATLRKYNFGVCTDGMEVLRFNQIVCTDKQAALIVAILDFAKKALPENHYFAADYAKED